MQKFVLVTGASKGIGRATSLYLKQKSFEVFAGVRQQADAEIAAQAGLIPLILDVTNAEQVEQSAEAVANIVGGYGLYGLINNAGIATPGPLEYLPPDNLRHQLEVNVVGQIAVTQAFLPLLRYAQGRILMVSSVGGRVSTPMFGAYHASKFALEAICDALRVELHDAGVSVVSIEPGVIATPIWSTSNSGLNSLRAQLSPTALEQYQHFLDYAESSMRSAPNFGIAPEKVARVIHKSLTVRRPKSRYLVGNDALLGSRVFARLPDRLRDILIRIRVHASRQ